jgi:hypothetical protein
MNSRQSLDALLTQFSQAAGVACEPLNEEGVAAIGFDGDVVVNVAAYDTTDLIHLFATLSTVPADRDAMRHAMQLALCFNRDMVGAQAGGIGLTPDESEFFLSAQLPVAQLDGEAFSLHLLAFAELCRHARLQLTEPLLIAHAEVEELSQDDIVPGSMVFV